MPLIHLAPHNIPILKRLCAKLAPTAFCPELIAKGWFETTTRKTHEGTEYALNQQNVDGELTWLVNGTTTDPADVPTHIRTRLSRILTEDVEIAERQCANGTAKAVWETIRYAA